ncbi:MAG: Protein TolB [Ignavibacteria bacterium]|nr:Protein TolB [Ignavibacteria bacterium]
MSGMNFHKYPKPSFLTIVFIFLFLFSGTAFSQFGQNKVQYKVFDWKYLQTKHFDIYFSQGGKYLAEFTAYEAEKALKNLSDNIDYRISNRIPIIVYNSHNDFQQNNVIDEYMTEGVGGVTELFKNRINVPFEGDYEKFRHVIHHELVHAYMNDMYYGGSIQNIISRNISLQFPLWFSEGMAEVQSNYGLNEQTDMFMRDAAINNYVPDLDYMGGYFAYRGGQSFFSFLADVYGEDKIGILMNNIRAFSDVEQGFAETYKMNLSQLNEKWHSYLKKTYWPDLKIREDVRDFAKQLTDHERDGGSYNVAPAISPDGSLFAYISNRDDLFDVFIAKTRNGEIVKKLIEGNNSSDFEELHILTPGLSWSPNGRQIAISVKSGDHDAIYVIDVNSEDKVELPVSFDAINFLSWSPVGNKIAFVGNTRERSDLFYYDLTKKKLVRLTDDIFSDLNPAWTLDGKSIAFTSDRGAYVNPAEIPTDLKMWEYDYSNSDYYRINIETREITRLSDSRDSKESYAQVSQDGKKVLYVSDKNGINNIYMRETDSAGNRTDRPITNSMNPIDQITMSRDGSKLLFIALNKGGYDIFSMDNPLEKKLEEKELVLTDYKKKKNEYESKFGWTINSPKKDTSALSVDSLIKKDKEVNENLTESDSTKAGSNSVPDTIDTSLNDTLSLSEEQSISGLNESNEDTAKYYGDDVKISFDLPELKLKPDKDSSYDFNENFSLAGNTNPDGSYKINKYKIKFTPDLVYGNASYQSFYGLQGVAQIVLSDMLGDHRIYIQTSLVIDLKNSDYSVSYFYLPKRIDYGFQLYHTARFLTYGYRFQEYLYRYRTIGGNISASYPISRFKRIDGNISIQHISRENLDLAAEPITRKTLLVPSFSLIHDNTIFGYTAPISGTRYYLTFMGSPKLHDEGIGFASILTDFRHYIKLGDDYTFVTRFAGGGSIGPNPQRFFIGGTENWINREYENYNIPISNIEEYAFSFPGFPLRGYNYDRMSGSKYGILNLEMRFPLFKYLILGALPLGFANIEGVTFLDAGTAWSDNEALKFIHKDENGNVTTNDLLLGTGFGARTNFLGFPIMFDIAWRYNLDKFSEPKYYISFGYDF